MTPDPMQATELTAEEQATVEAFHRLWYGRMSAWCGIPLLKNPMDLQIYQNILWATAPETIIECGTWVGGSALYLAMLCDLMGHGRVITIDVMHEIPELYRWAFQDMCLRPEIRMPASHPVHPRITYVHGSSVDRTTFRGVRSLIEGRTMVILDSDHEASHVRRECELYAPLVSPGCYLVVEDVNISGHPVTEYHEGPGPYEATEGFLKDHSEFTVDPKWVNCFLFTYNAYLLRKE